MAFLCVKCDRECCGCGDCQEREPQIVGECAECSELIYDYEERYDIEGELIHADCLTDWADKYRVRL